MSRNSDTNLTWTILGFLLFVTAASPALGYLLSNAFTPAETQVTARWPAQTLPMQDWTLKTS